MKKTYIFGHKTPDTDSVCASIALSYLKNKLGYNTEPRVLGNINKETNFVLKYFHVKEPSFLNDVKVKIKDMKYEKNAIINEHESIIEAYRYMNKLGVTGLPIVDDNQYLIGYVNIKEISSYLIDTSDTYINTSYDNLIKDLNGKVIQKYDDNIEGFLTNISSNNIKSTKTSKEIIIIDNNKQKIEINDKIGLIILLKDVTVTDELLEQAKSCKINIISVPYNSFEIVSKLKLSNYVILVNVNTHPITFNIMDYRNDFIDITKKYGHTNYPLVDKNKKCIGMLRIVNINEYEKQSVILVDHNSKEQSVDGLEESIILDIVDHHNISMFGTNMPINFRAMPVGCTCTIIYKLFNEYSIPIPKDIAGLMVSAIISDTLLFRSPTTTEEDKIAAEKLAEIADINLEKYGYEMFARGSSIEGLSIEQIINSDMKIYKYEGSSLAIGEIMTMDFKEIAIKKDQIIKTLNNMCILGNHKYALLFIIDIINNGSYLLYSDNAKEIIGEAFNIDNVVQGIYLDGVVSRKKQILPALLEIEDK